MPKTECVTENPLYQVLHHELLSKAAPGRPTRQAPRMLVAMLKSIEQLVVKEGELPYIRLHAGGPCCRTGQACDSMTKGASNSHQLESPSWGSRGASLAQKRRAQTRQFCAGRSWFDSICYVSEPHWLEAGRKIMKQIADFERDYLMPAPSQNFRGARRMELRYDAGVAIQNRVLSLMTCEGSRLIPPQLTGFWTPHSGISFMPSCCAALQFTKDQRNYLGRWSAEVSDRYARVAVLRIRTLQGAVVTSIQNTCPSPTAC